MSAARATKASGAPAPSAAACAPPRPVDDHTTAAPSPARQLQHDLQTAVAAWTTAPIAADAWSARRALKFIAPTSAGFIVLVGLLNHAMAHH